MKTKVELQGKRAKSRHNLSHDITTTSDFGFCQPMGVKEITPQSTISKAHNIFVRAQPLVKPTYGRLKGYQYDVFVKTSDLYHPFPQLLSGQTFSGVTSYVPTFVPRISLGVLKLLLCQFARVTIWEYSGSGNSNLVYEQGSSVAMAVVDTTPTPGGAITFDDFYLALFSTYTNLVDSAPPAPYLEDWKKSFAWKNGSRTSEYSSLYNTLEFGGTPIDPYAEADFTFSFKGSSFPGTSFNSSATYLCAFRLTPRGRNIRKVLLGCGYQLNSSNKSVSLLPLMAYYKSWFDLFAPQRFVTWSSTPLFRLLELIENYNFDMASVSWWHHTIADDINVIGRSRLFAWFVSLGECYFTEAPDYVSAHITGTAISSTQNFLRTTGPDGQDIEVVSGFNEQAHVDNSSTGIPQSLNVLSRAQLRAINFLAKYVNIRTVAGGRIDKFLKSVYGANYNCCESNFVNSDTFNIDISDVMNQSETDKGALGEYAGKGLGLSKGSRLKYSPHEDMPGFLVSLFAIVPDSKYAQGVDPNLFHCEKFDFYTPGFDGITLVPNSKLSVYATLDVEFPNQFNSYNLGSFGNIPVYSEYKQHQSILNGDCSLRSTRSSYLPFTLDKLLPYKDYVVSYRTDGSNVKHLRLSNQPDNGVTPSLITNGTLWRYVGRYRWLGQYDRIFYNTGDVSSWFSYANNSHDPLDDCDNLVDDNFIVHCYVDMSEFSNKLPLGESFDTGAEGDNSSLSVQHQ